MRKPFALMMTLFLLVSSIEAANTLRVGNPRFSWYTYQGTIEEATLSIKPKGIYYQYDLYLTFSARGTSYTSNDSLEVVFNFDLPENSIVNDSWLWLNDSTIIKARIMDKWSATAIYEGIVARRQDPSLLTKTSNTHYELRVFPMAGGTTRKVKISYLVAADWNKRNVSSKLPTELLNTSLNTVSKLSVITWPDAEWQNPQILNYPNFSFNQQYTNTQFGSYRYTEISPSYYNSSLSFSYNSPLVNGVYLNKYQDVSENYYQMVLLPSEILTSIPKKKVIVLVDYDEFKTSYTKTQLLTELKNSLISQLSIGDSFNLMYSNFAIQKASTNWIHADSLSITNAFNTLNNQLADYSNLSSLIAEGINFINTHGNSGKIFLLTDADQYGSSAVANNLVNDILGYMNPDFPIYIADFQTTNYTWNMINGRYYFGNEYFYSNLATITNGSYNRTFRLNNPYYGANPNNYTISDILRNSIDELSGIISAFNLYTTMSGGYCHSRYNLNTQLNTAYLNKPILQTGKYVGGFPFNVIVSGDYNSTIFNTSLQYGATDFHNADSSDKAVWAGLYIKDLESQTQTNSIISNIITKSLSNRVLSKYTAFICLEDSVLYCDNCADESSLVSIEELEEDSIITAYPNPFDDDVTIKLGVKNPDKYSDATFNITNILGEVVYTFSFSEVNKNEYLEFKWNGKTLSGDELAQGIYIFNIISTNGSKNIKLIKQ